MQVAPLTHSIDWLQNYSRTFLKHVTFGPDLILTPHEGVSEQELGDVISRLTRDADKFDATGCVFRYNACRLVLKIAEDRKRARHPNDSFYQVIDELNLPEQTGHSHGSWTNWVGQVSSIPEGVFVPGVKWGHFLKVANMGEPENNLDWPKLRQEQRKLLEKLASSGASTIRQVNHGIDDIHEAVGMKYTRKGVTGTEVKNRLILACKTARLLLDVSASEEEWQAHGYESYADARTKLINLWSSVTGELVNMEVLSADPFEDCSKSEAEATKLAKKILAKKNPASSEEAGFNEGEAGGEV